MPMTATNCFRWYSCYKLMVVLFNFGDGGTLKELFLSGNFTNNNGTITVNAGKDLFFQVVLQQQFNK